MSKDPAVLFYTSDFLSGTAFFSMDERGKYITLLCEQHQLWSIPLSHLVDVCGSLESPVAKKFIPDTELPGHFFNLRMREESLKRKSFCESRRSSASKRYSSKTDENAALAGAYAAHTQVRMENENDNVLNTTEDSNTRKKIITKRRKSVMTIPTEEEFLAYCSENGFANIAKRAFKYYSEQNWHDSQGRPIHSWKGKLQGVWFRDENRDANQGEIDWSKVFNGGEKIK